MSDETIAPQRLWVPGLAGLYERLAPLSYPLMRGALGLILGLHGVNKMFFGDAEKAMGTFAKLGLSPPYAWAYAIGIFEAVGGAMLALGLLTRLVALGVAVEMCVIAFGVLWPSWWWNQRGMEYVTMMGIYALAIAFRGGGRCSLDRVLRKEL